MQGCCWAHSGRAQLLKRPPHYQTRMCMPTAIPTLPRTATATGTSALPQLQAPPAAPAPGTSSLRCAYAWSLLAFRGAQPSALLISHTCCTVDSKQCTWLSD